MFYRLENGKVISGNVIHNKAYKLDDKSDKKKNVDGWQWFETDEAAYAFFKVDYLDAIYDNKDELKLYIDKLKKGQK